VYGVWELALVWECPQAIRLQSRENLKGKVRFIIGGGLQFLRIEEAGMWSAFF
jgi:hypothetical protein